MAVGEEDGGETRMIEQPVTDEERAAIALWAKEAAEELPPMREMMRWIDSASFLDEDAEEDAE